MKKFKIYFWKRIPNVLFKEIKEEYRDRRRDYMNVYFCSDYDEMYRLGDKLDRRWEQELEEHNYGARTFCHDKIFIDSDTGEMVGISPQCGEMIFNDEYFSNNIISHECCHAVIGYFSRKLEKNKEVFTEVVNHELVKDNMVNEELMCYMIGSLVEQICAEAVKEG